MSEVETTEVESEKYDFGVDFETLMMAYMLRDTGFHVRTEGLIRPEYFTSEAHRSLAAVVNAYYQDYKAVPTKASVGLMLKEALDKKRIKAELRDEVVDIVKEAYRETLTDTDYVIEQVVKFARKQALTNAVLKAAEKIDRNDFEGVDELVTQATLVGQHEDAEQYDFWKEAESRRKIRQAIVAGTIKPTGITTGFHEIDRIMYHKGWGRKELSLLMGPAKSGKSMALVTFSMKAALAGYNVLYVSLEVSKNIIADRLEASLSGIKINDLAVNMKKAEDASNLAAARSGHLKVHDYASGTFQPNQLRRLLRRYDAAGIKFDMVVLDYADLMAPNKVSNEPRENSRTIYVDLRGIAHEFDLALLTATQTNRAGFKAALGDMEHVSDDINKVRTVDLMISLNRDEADKDNGEARLYFAASRNQEAAIVQVKADIGSSRYVESIVKVTS